MDCQQNASLLAKGARSGEMPLPVFEQVCWLQAWIQVLRKHLWWSWGCTSICRRLACHAPSHESHAPSLNKSQLWWSTPVTPAFRKWRWVILSYIASSRPVWDACNLGSKQNKQVSQWLLSYSFMLRQALCLPPKWHLVSSSWGHTSCSNEERHSFYQVPGLIVIK